MNRNDRKVQQNLNEYAWYAKRTPKSRLEVPSANVDTRMFGRHPRLAIDAFLGLRKEDETIRKRHKDYVDGLKSRLGTAYRTANEEAKAAARKQKKHYDKKVRHVVLQPVDIVLVRNVGLKRRQKLADIWDKYPYIAKRQPIDDIPVYEVQRESDPSRTKLLHRNMLLPFCGLPYTDESEEEEQNELEEETPVEDKFKLHYKE